MEDDDIRQALHATYIATGAVPTLTPDAFEEHAVRPRRRPLVTSLVAVVAAVVVAVPIGVGVLLRSGVNGGSSGSSMSVLDLHMYGADDGWAWSGGDNILHTNSGVQHWTVVPPPIGSDSIVEVAWVNADSARVLAIYRGVLDDVERTYPLTTWITDNGGATWTRGVTFNLLLETAQAPDTTTDLHFVDPLHGWFFDTQDATVGAPIIILRTVDGGIHWAAISKTPATGSAARGALPVTCEKYGLTFLNSTTGWVAGGCLNAPPFFYVTHNGGATWSPQAIDCGENCYLDPPQFTSPLDGYMTGQLGLEMLFVTRDGGKTWQPRPNPPASNLDFIDATHGFTLGLNGNDNPAAILWRTDDGGTTWSEAPHGAIHGTEPTDIGQLDFIGPTTGWDVSLYITSGGGLLTNGQTPYPVPAPELWQTKDAGTTWTQVTPTFTTSR
jgi:photosystem II stability/assembly factor-like uncharacterized protein